jgi:hypothetical protein
MCQESIRISGVYFAAAFTTPDELLIAGPGYPRDPDALHDALLRGSGFGGLLLPQATDDGGALLGRQAGVVRDRVDQGLIAP